MTGPTRTAGLDPDPLTPLDYDQVWQDGHDLGVDDGWSLGYAAGARIRPVAIIGISIAWLVIGFILANAVQAASRAEQLPAIPGSDAAQLGAPPGAAAWTPTEGAGAAVRSEGGAPPPSPARAPRPSPASPAREGTASWYGTSGPGIYAAAGPGLRTGHWRGRIVVVCASSCITARLTDWCACPRRLIDLSADAFARLAPLSRGLVRVTVTPVGPVATPPATDS